LAGAAPRYAVAIGVVLAVVLLKSISRGLGADHPFILLPGAVVIAAWYGGRGPGLLATVLVALASLYLFLPPAGFAAEPNDLIAVVALVAEGGLITFLTTALRAALERARAASAASQAAHREAEFALAVRDELLLLWTQKLRGPMADIESQARAALADIESEGYSGAATPKLRKLVDEAAFVGRATAGWDEDGNPSGTVPTS
jgi:K+-sensing histidine kinase KdpD